MKPEVYQEPSENDFDASSRNYILIWLGEVCDALAMCGKRSSLRHLIDQYSHSRPVPKQRIQLLGISCLFISAKLVEKIPPSITAFAASTDGGVLWKISN